MIIRTWTATDNCGNSTTRTQSLSIQDIVAPVLVHSPASTCGAYGCKYLRIF
ncbi:MAG: hypothetical protein R2879_00785 [Saprospiraceae bacterium]